MASSRLRPLAQLPCPRCPLRWLAAGRSNGTTQRIALGMPGSQRCEGREVRGAKYRMVVADTDHGAVTHNHNHENGHLYALLEITVAYMQQPTYHNRHRNAAWGRICPSPMAILSVGASDRLRRNKSVTIPEQEHNDSNLRPPQGCDFVHVYYTHTRPSRARS